ncbi:hypothetical protein ACE1CM_07945 [Microseira sp. BLCC-F43]
MMFEYCAWFLGAVKAISTFLGKDTQMCASTKIDFPDECDRHHKG